MTLLNVSSFRELARSLRNVSEDDPPLSIELSRRLEDLRKVSLNLLMAFLTVHAISASHVLAAMTLAFLVYTINLHIAVNSHCLQCSPILSTLLHAIPLLGIFCMAVFKLVTIVQSPVIITGVLFTCALPPLLIATHFVKRCTEVLLLMLLPVQTRDVAPAASGPNMY